MPKFLHDHTAEVETILKAIIIKPNDVCAFFIRKEGVYDEDTCCRHCIYGCFDDKKLPTGLCKYKKSED